MRTDGGEGRGGEGRKIMAEDDYKFRAEWWAYYCR